MSTVAIVLSEAGYHWEEAAAAHKEWDAARWKTVYYTPSGHAPRPDPTSLLVTPLALRAVGYGTTRNDGPDAQRNRKLAAQIASPHSLREFDVDGTDAIYVVGGHGSLQDINRDKDLHRIIEALYLKGSVLSSVCHATSTLAFAKRPDGKSIVSGKRMTGCPNIADEMMIRLGMVHKAYLPLPLINDDELRRAGAHINPIVAAANPHYTVVDLPFITGVGPKAAASVARKVIHARWNDRYTLDRNARLAAQPAPRESKQPRATQAQQTVEAIV
jgi:putative intracellular protease/amidase